MYYLIIKGSFWRNRLQPLFCQSLKIKVEMVSLPWPACKDGLLPQVFRTERCVKHWMRQKINVFLGSFLKDQMDAKTRSLRSRCSQSPPCTFKCLLCQKLSAEGFREGSLGSPSSCLNSSDICSRVRKNEKVKRLLLEVVCWQADSSMQVFPQHAGTEHVCFVFLPSRLPRMPCTSSHVVVGGAT